MTQSTRKAHQPLRQRIFEMFRNPFFDGGSVPVDQSGEILSSSRVIPSKDKTNINQRAGNAVLKLPYYPNDGVELTWPMRRNLALQAVVYCQPQGWGLVSQIDDKQNLVAGDAAMSFDPLSSHGMTCAMYMAEKAAVAIKGHFKGVPDALKQYSQSMSGC